MKTMRVMRNDIEMTMRSEVVRTMVLEMSR